MYDYGIETAIRVEVPSSFRSAEKLGLETKDRKNTKNMTTLLRGTASLIIWGSIKKKTTTTSTTVDEEALNAWWTNEHLPERLAIPGFLRTRRDTHVARIHVGSGQPNSKHKTLYAVTGIDEQVGLSTRLFYDTS
ncbi:hypothetical protein ABEF94_008553 [Exophiala dermatitidis]